MSDKTIQVKPWGDDQGDFVLINEDDFDKDVHELFGDKKQSAKDKKATDAAAAALAQAQAEADAAAAKWLADTQAALTAKGIAFDAAETREQLQVKLDAAQ